MFAIKYQATRGGPWIHVITVWGYGSRDSAYAWQIFSSYAASHRLDYYAASVELP